MKRIDQIVVRALNSNNSALSNDKLNTFMIFHRSSRVCIDYDKGHCSLMNIEIQVKSMIYYLLRNTSSVILDT